MLSVALASFAIIGGQSGQNQSLFNQVIGKPTGENGYEEYVLAAQMVAQDKPGFEAALSTKPGTLLTNWRQLTARHHKALEMVRSGNRKPVFDPRTSIDSETLFPELTYFKTLAKLFTYDAYVRFAGGASSGGTQSIMDGLTFSRKVAQHTLISYLVGIASSSIMFGQAERHLPQLSEHDAKALIAFCDQAMLQDDPLVKAIEGEWQFSKASAIKLVDDPKSQEALFYGDEYEQLLDKLKQVPEHERANLKQQVVNAIDQHFRDVLHRLRQPMSQWDFIEPEVDGLGLVEELMDMFKPVFAQSQFVSAKHQVQVRLLRAHASIIEYRWQNGMLPDTIKDIPSDHALDPITDKPFVYRRLTEHTYELYSPGFKNTGRIDLKYVNPSAGGGGEAPPPAL